MIETIQRFFDNQGKMVVKIKYWFFVRIYAWSDSWRTGSFIAGYIFRTLKSEVYWNF